MITKIQTLYGSRVDENPVPAMRARPAAVLAGGGRSFGITQEQDVYKRQVFALQDSLSYDFTQFFQFMAASAKAVSQSAPGERIHIDNPLEQPGNTLIVPDLDHWLKN